MRIDSKRTIAMIAGVALTACLGLAACSAENTGSNLSETGDSQANTEQVSVASGQNDPYVSDDACLAATAAPMKALQRAPNRMAIPILTTQFMAATCHAMYVMLGVMR